MYHYNRAALLFFSLTAGCSLIAMGGKYQLGERVIKAVKITPNSTWYYGWANKLTDDRGKILPDIYVQKTLANQKPTLWVYKIEGDSSRLMGILENNGRIRKPTGVELDFSSRSPHTGRIVTEFPGKLTEGQYTLGGGYTPRYGPAAGPSSGRGWGRLIYMLYDDKGKLVEPYYVEAWQVGQKKIWKFYVIKDEIGSTRVVGIWELSRPQPGGFKLNEPGHIRSLTPEDNKQLQERIAAG